MNRHSDCIPDQSFNISSDAKAAKRHLRQNEMMMLSENRIILLRKVLNTFHSPELAVTREGMTRVQINVEPRSFIRHNYQQRSNQGAGEVSPHRYSASHWHTITRTEQKCSLGYIVQSLIMCSWNALPLQKPRPNGTSPECQDPPLGGGPGPIGSGIPSGMIHKALCLSGEAGQEACTDLALKECSELALEKWQWHWLAGLFLVLQSPMWSLLLTLVLLVMGQEAVDNLGGEWQGASIGGDWQGEAIGSNRQGAAIGGERQGMSDLMQQGEATGMLRGGATAGQRDVATGYEQWRVASGALCGGKVQEKGTPTAMKNPESQPASSACRPSSTGHGSLWLALHCWLWHSEEPVSKRQIQPLRQRLSWWVIWIKEETWWSGTVLQRSAQATHEWQRLKKWCYRLKKMVWLGK